MNRCCNTLIQKMFALITGITCLTVITSAGAAETITEAITSGKSSGSLRYFYEGVRNPGQIIKKADASTARLRFGYETAAFYNFAVMVEAETVHAFGAKNYDSTVNGKTNYSVIVDPEGTEMNQAFISYNEVDSKTAIKWGRQRINLDNSRFIGTRSWRQNEQTYDSFMLVNNYLPDTTITAGYLTNLNRPNTDAAIAPFGGRAGNFKMNSPILNVKYKGLTAGEVVAYGYMLDFDLPAGATFANRSQFDSTKTFGLRFKGSTPMDSNNLLYTAEYATQSSYKDNPATYTNKYLFAEGGIDFKIAEFKLSHEVLGGDGANAFSTPLASLHNVNGWVDKFVTIPASGLKDTFFTAATTIADIHFMAVYRDYRADTGGAKYGTEWNFQATKKFDQNYMVAAKYAAFKTSATAQNTTQPWNFDTNKFWVWGEMQF
ncbi:MAG: alginate export family protein [Candidatus Nitrotoga sp.]